MDWEQIAYDLYVIAGRHLNPEFKRQFNEIRKKYENPSNEIEVKISNLLKELEKEDNNLIEILKELEVFFAEELRKKISCPLNKERPKRQFKSKKWWL